MDTRSSQSRPASPDDGPIGQLVSSGAYVVHDLPVGKAAVERGPRCFIGAKLTATFDAVGPPICRDGDHGDGMFGVS